MRFSRQNVDSFHDQILEKILVITKRLNIPLSKPRTNKRQIYKDNHPASRISVSQGVFDYSASRLFEARIKVKIF